MRLNIRAKHILWNELNDHEDIWNIYADVEVSKMSIPLLRQTLEYVIFLLFASVFRWGEAYESACLCRKKGRGQVDW